MEALVNGNVSSVQVDSVRASGTEDGRMAAAAYCDGFFDGVARELKSRFSGFQMIDVEAIEQSVEQPVDLVPTRAVERDERTMLSVLPFSPYSSRDLI